MIFPVKNIEVDYPYIDKVLFEMNKCDGFKSRVFNSGVFSDGFNDIFSEENGSNNVLNRVCETFFDPDLFFEAFGKKSVEDTSLYSYAWGKAKVKVLDFSVFDRQNNDGNDYDDERVFVLIGGLGVNVYDWQDLVCVLGRTARVLVVDMLGVEFDCLDSYGYYHSLFTQVHVLEQVLSTCGVESCVLLGHSMGALVAESFARVFPSRIDNLILLDGSYESLENRDKCLKNVDFTLFSGGFSVEWVNRIYAFLSACPTSYVFFSWFYYLFRGKVLKTLSKDDDRVVFYDYFAFDNGLLKMFSFNKSYMLWVKQLEALSDVKDLCSNVLIVGASRSFGIYESAWIKGLREKCLLMTISNSGLKIRFLRVFASHLLMRNIPVRLGKIISRFIGDESL